MKKMNKACLLTLSLTLPEALGARRNCLRS
jgi:hypothetical protein